MSRINEKIALSINLVQKTYVDTDGKTQPLKPRSAYLVQGSDKTHERYVTDDNANVSKQSSIPQSTIDGINNRITAVETVNTQQETKIGQNAADITAVKGDVTDLQGKVAGNTGTVSALAQQVAQNKTDADTKITNLTNSTNNSITRIDGKNAAQDNEIVNLKEKDANLQAQIHTIENNLGSGVRGVLRPNDPKPTVDAPGKYDLSGIGTFTNLVPIIPFGESQPTNTPVTVTEGFYNSVFWDGIVFKQLMVAVPQANNYIPEYVIGTTYTGPVQVIESGAIFHLPASAGQNSEIPSQSSVWIKISQSVSDMNLKVDKVVGKGLSTKDYTAYDQEKVGKLRTTGDGKSFLADNGEYKSLSGGSGSGYYNITTKFPLATGYYTLQTAVAALAASDTSDLDVKGMIITFESNANVWEDYRFLGSTNVELGQVALWELMTVKNVVKSLDLFLGTSTQHLTPDPNGNINLVIPIVEVDETLSPDGTNPVQGKAIYAYINQKIAGLGASLLLNTVEEGVYSMSLLDENGNVISTSGTFSGGGGTGPGGVRVVLTRVDPNPTVKLGDEVKLKYFYDQVDSTSGESTGNGATATITVVRGATTNTFTQQIAAGTTNTIDVTEYLAVGTSSVRVKIVTNDTLAQVSSISWTVTVVQLVLESSYNISTKVAKGSAFSLPYTLTGSGSKTLRLYVDGVQVEDKVITTSTSNGAFTYNTSNLANGTHSFQMVAILELPDGKVIRSNSIYFGVIITEPNFTIPIFGTRFNYNDGTIIEQGQLPYVDATQYTDYSIIFALYDPTKPVAPVTITVAGNVIANLNVSEGRNEIKGRSAVAGTLPATLKSGVTAYDFRVIAKQLDIDITEPTDNVVLKLSSIGKSNSDADRDKWQYTGTRGLITTTFTGFTWSGNGWVNGALRVNGNAKAVVNFNPLSQGVAPNNSLTYLTRFKVSNLTDPTAPVISCLDAAGTGFVITGQDAKMVSRGGSEVTTKFAEGETYNIGFVSFPTATGISTEYEKQNSGMLYLYVNGVICGGVQRGTADDIFQANATFVTYGTNGKATLDVTSIRTYSRYMTDSEMFNLYLIDLNDVDLLLKKYKDNNILDSQGNITVDNLPPFLPYMVITGKQENGVPTVLQAATINSKSQKFNVDEILFVNPLIPTKNFRLTGGYIRLQGTSSLAYPTKNYRIYLYNASNVQGDFYLGVDGQGAGGTLQPKPNFYSFKDATPTQKTSAPANLWTIKVDYAESSGSHNTGMARIVNEVMTLAGDKTPVQKKAASSYQYDVRTTIDGFPMALFYRATVNDTPVFLSKANFNNDKSSQNVFGFEGVTGYHDAQWVTDKFGGKNPTECWEFLNNDYPMGSYLDADFDIKDTDGKARWTKVFEARYPDNSATNAEYENGTKKPFYLERFVKWVNSTLNDPDKFANELKDYADVDHLCSYYNYTDVFAAVDQRVKNQMLAFYYDPDKDKVLAYFIFYDNDTILGVRNDGKLKYSWDIDENTIDPELSQPGRPVYAFAGHDSVLWKNLRLKFASKITESYTRLRTRMSNDYIFNMFDKEQSSKYVERVYNIDAIKKYVLPQTIGIDVINGGVTTNQKFNFLESMQGPRTSHRHWYLLNRLDLFDARHGTGNYRAIDLNWKGNSAIGATVKAVPARDYYISFFRESQSMKTEFVKAGQEFTYTYPQEANIGTIFHLYGGNWLKSVDLSAWGGFTSITIPRMQVLETLILGKTGTTYTLPSITFGDSLPLLKTLDITNYTALATVDLTGSPLLDTVIATGCSALTSIQLAPSSPIRVMRLPANYAALTLRGLPLISNAGITFENVGNLTYLWVENTPNVNANTILQQAIMADPSKKRYVRFAVNITDDGTQLRNWIGSNLGGINTDGTTAEDKITLTGNYQLTKYMDDAEFAAMKLKFPELSLSQPAYTYFKVFTNDPNNGSLILDPKSIQNVDNGTGYGTGKSYLVNGHMLKLIKTKHRFLGKQSVKGTMTLIQLHDEDSRKFNDNIDPLLATPASLEGTMGDVWVKEPSYWYKAVTDFYKGVIHYAVSSNEEMPPVPSETITKKITRATLSAITDGIVNGRYIRQGNVYVNDAYLPNSDYSTLKVPVDGWKKLKCVVQPNTGHLSGLCSVWTEEDGRIISEFKPDFQTYSPGSDIVFDIPANAKYFHITIAREVLTNYMQNFYFVVSNSDNPLDWEPEWVKSDVKLHAVFDTSYFNSKIRSVATLQQPQMSQSVIDNALNARGLSSVTYEGYKNMMHMAMFKYGTNDVKTYIGAENSVNVWGSSAPYGVKDTTTNGTTLQSGYYIKDETGATVFKPTGVTTLLGYESLITGSSVQIVRDGVTGFNQFMLGSFQNYQRFVYFNADNKRKFITAPQGAESPWQGVPERYSGGKFFDLFPYNSKTNPSNSANQTTASAVNRTNNLGSIAFRNEWIGGSESQGLGSFTSNGFSYAQLIFRLAFVGNIVEITNVNQFKAIVEAV